MTRFIFLLLTLIAPSSLLAQSMSKGTIQKILIAQDLRDTKVLQALSRNSNPMVRARAAFAIGSVQDVSTIPQLHLLLGDVDAGVRQAAAFGLGQMNYVADSVRRRAVSGALVERLGVEKDKRVLHRLIEALGKIGDAPSLAELLWQADKISSSSLHGEIALAIGRYAYRGVKSQQAATAAAMEFEKGSKSERWKAAYALFRIGNSNLLGSHTRQIVAAASDTDPNVRMYVANLLGKFIAAPSNLEVLVQLSENDPDWRVRVNAVKALALLNPSSSSRQVSALSKAFDDPDEHVSLAAIQTVVMKEDKKLERSHPAVMSLERIFTGESDRYSVRQQRESAIAFARLLGDPSFVVLAQQAQGGRILMNTYIEALGFIGTEASLRTLLKYSKQNDARTQRLSFESLLSVTRIVKPAGILLDSARSCFIGGLSSSDIAVITTAASALAESLLADGSSVPPLIAALKRLESTSNTEPMTAIIQTLGALKAGSATSILTDLLGGKNHVVAKEAAAALEAISGFSYKHKLVQPAKPEHTNLDWALLDWIRKHPSVDVRTIRGTFTFTMLLDEAPFTCTNFAQLIRKGFFNGLTFHRVVPNFVIQGGDPHGDGWGGPGYAIRSEFGYEHYERGTMGMASSGKDTEGSQFFVTHSSQPHLDGRYTIFGKVISGMDVVDAIQVGDMIEQMSFSNTGEPERGR